MDISKTLYVPSRDEWHDWLSKHHEEALCFGWIDSIVKRINDEKFAQKFTPRRDCTKWSARNIRRVRTLIRDGRMTEAGLAKIDITVLDQEPQAKRRKNDLDIPRFVKRALMSNPKAWEHFQNLAPSYRRQYIAWIMDAKREQTRERRMREAVSLLQQNKKLGLK